MTSLLTGFGAYHVKLDTQVGALVFAGGIGERSGQGACGEEGGVFWNNARVEVGGAKVIYISTVFEENGNRLLVIPTNSGSCQ